MRLLAVQKEVDCFPYALVLDLAVQVFVDDLRPLFGGNVGEQVGAQVARYRNVIAGPGLAGSVDQPRVEAEQHMRLHFAGRDACGIDVMAVE